MDPLVAAVVVYSLLIVHAEAGNPINATFKGKIIGYLQELCPRSGVCSNEERDTQSCCGACSCDPDCEMDNCCFSRQPNNRSIGTKYHSKRNHSQCMYPFSKPPANRAERRSYQAYFIVTSSPNEHKSVTVPCGDKRVAPWGSFYPVISRTDGKIYKNQFCAEAYNVTEWEHWEAYLSCDGYSFEWDGAGYIAALYNGFVPKQCYIRFNFKAALLKSEICYVSEDYLNYCRRADFPIPSVTTASKEDILTACSSGFMSPYLGFSNVFCTICSGLYLNTCREQKMDTKSYVSSSFSSLIAPNYLDSNDNDQLHNLSNLKEDVNTACIVTVAKHALSHERCRRIVCPAGQTYDDTNTCIYPGNEWTVKKITILTNVTSKQHFSILPLFAFIGNLKSPFSEGWYVEEVAYQVTNAERTSSSLAVFLSREFRTSFQPTFLLKSLIEDSNKPWRLVFSNETIALNAELSRVKAIYKHDDRIGFNMPSAGYKLIYANYEKNKRSMIQITQLYFCEQVILQPWEYVYNTQDDTLTNIITNDTLFNGEFTWFENHDGMSPLVCLETSGFQRILTSNSSKTVLHKIKCLAFVLLTKVLLNIVLSLIDLRV